MSPESMFRRAIINKPDAAQPRLEFASWLDERCDPLGEFIRVQQRLARRPQALTADVRLELETRERELLGEFEADWAGEIPELVEWWSFRRGFVEEIALSAAAFLEHGERLLALAPIRLVHFSRVDEIEPLAASALLRRLRFIDLSDIPLGNAGVRVLAGSNLTGVRGLNLTGVGIANSGAQALSRSPALHALRELYLSHNRIGDAGAYALAKSRQLAKLRILCLRNNPVAPEAIEAVQQRFEGRTPLPVAD